jgi:hypothetical protein
MKLSLCLVLLALSVSCAQVRSVSQTSIPKKRGTPVQAEVKNNIFLLLNFKTDYLNDLHTQLKASCPKGSVEGILTKDVFITYFPVFFHREHITAEGYCVE